MANKKAQDVELFTEILASDQLGGFQYFGYNLFAQATAAEDPTATWRRLTYDPWFAMTVYADMEEKDAKVSSCLDARKYNVLSKPRNVLPASESRSDRKVAEFIEETLNRYFCNFDSFLDEALDAIGKGVSIGEIIFGDGPDRIYVETVKFKPQHLFCFGETDIAGYSTTTMAYPQTGPLRLRAGVNVEQYALGQELPEDKFFVFSFRPKYGNRWGSPVDRKAFWPSWIKRASIRQWLKYQEKGSGVVVARYNDGAAEAEQETARDAASAVQEESAVAIPKKFLLEVHEMVRNIGSSHKELVDDFCNAEIANVYLGQTLTSRGSDGGGSRALGEVHERKEETITESDARSLMAVIDYEIIRPLVMFNFGPDVDRPRYVIDYEPKEDLQAKAKLFATVHKDIGIALSRKQITEILGLEQPADEEDTLPAAAEASKPGTNDPLDDSLVEAAFAEGDDVKKKLLPGSSTRSSSRMERFKRQRPSMIEFSDE